MMPSLDCITSAQERDVSAERALERVFGQYFELKPADLIFTGTSAGVGPVKRGDVLEGSIEGVAALRVRVGGE